MVVAVLLAVATPASDVVDLTVSSTGFETLAVCISILPPGATATPVSVTRLVSGETVGDMFGRTVQPIQLAPPIAMLPEARTTASLLLWAPLARSTAPLPALILTSPPVARSEEHTSELQSLRHLVCRLLLE